MKLWKRIKMKRYCCEAEDGTVKNFKKRHKLSLKRRARALLKRLLKKEIGA